MLHDCTVTHLIMNENRQLAKVDVADQNFKVIAETLLFRSVIYERVVVSHDPVIIYCGYRFALWLVFMKHV